MTEAGLADRRLYSEDLADHGDPIGTAMNKMWLCQQHGWPDARGPLVIDPADDDEPQIWILKCKPNCWRLYFHVTQANRRFIYLYAVCKKKQRRDAEDATRARTRLYRIWNHRSGIVRFDFPTG